MQNKFGYTEKTLSDFKHYIRDYGWIVYENAVEPDFIEKINTDLTGAYEYRRRIQEENGINENMDGTLHHLLDRDNFSIPFLEKMYCHNEITFFLGGNYILGGMNAVIRGKDEDTYVSNMHRDVRTHMGDTKLLIQMIVTLDDFTDQNGATYFLSGSHKTSHRPDEAYFYQDAEQAITPKGSIILFDSNIWHASGANHTSRPRRALTLGYNRPFFKQQMDYSRFLGYDFVAGLSPELKQVIGYNARVPADLNEYYQPPHLRMYQRDQG